MFADHFYFAYPIAYDLYMPEFCTSLGKWAFKETGLLRASNVRLPTQ